MKNVTTEKFKISSGISQGKCTRGIFFCLIILPIYHSIMKSKIIRPLKILSSTITTPQKTGPKTDFVFPKSLGYSDNLSVLMFTNQEPSGKCSQIEFINDLHQRFQNISELHLNPIRLGVFSALIWVRGGADLPPHFKTMLEHGL